MLNNAMRCSHSTYQQIPEIHTFQDGHCGWRFCEVPQQTVVATCHSLAGSCRWQARGYVLLCAGLALCTTLLSVRVSYAQKHFSTGLAEKNKGKCENDSSSGTSIQRTTAAAAAAAGVDGKGCRYRAHRCSSSTHEQLDLGHLATTTTVKSMSVKIMGSSHRTPPPLFHLSDGWVLLLLLLLLLLLPGPGCCHSCLDGGCLGVCGHHLHCCPHQGPGLLH
jgi:hypothetical protein